MAKLSAEHYAFLRLLADHSGGLVPRSLLPVADRHADRIRQSCRREGLVKFTGGWNGKRREPMGWQITPAGRRALQDAGANP